MSDSGFEKKRTFVKNSSKNMILVAGGDLICASYVENAIKKYGADYPFIEIKSYIEKADISFANLECVISEKGKKRKKALNYGASLSSLESIIYSGIDVFSISNNHVYDMGDKGLTGMIELLDKSPLYFGGAGKNADKASEPLRVTVNGLKIAFIFYNSAEFGFCATENGSGTNCIKYDDQSVFLKILKKDVDKIKDADLRIISIHWGPNYNVNTSEHQVNFAHTAVDLGVDIILGHSSHIFHGIEIYKNSLILYDMGDFLINDDDAWDTRSFLYSIHVVNGKISKLELDPIYMPNSQIRVAEGTMADEINSRFVELSKRFNTHVEFIEKKMIIKVDTND